MEREEGIATRWCTVSPKLYLQTSFWTVSQIVFPRGIAQAMLHGSIYLRIRTNLEIHGVYSNGSPTELCPGFWNRSHVENSWNITMILYHTNLNFPLYPYFQNSLNDFDVYFWHLFYFYFFFGIGPQYLFTKMIGSLFFMVIDDMRLSFSVYEFSLVRVLHES
jgi:hypothetical protein